MFKVIAFIYLLLGGFLAYTSFSAGNILMGVFGSCAVVFSIGLLLNVRFFGYLMAAFFLGLIGVTVAAMVAKGEGITLPLALRLAFYAAMAVTCVKWARVKP
jgi:hypothetical protein